MRTLPLKYFITTPIFYVNSIPHIGHLYSAVLVDAISRWYRIRGVPTLFTTGTDEHGLKIQQAAQRANCDPGAFCDRVSREFHRLFDSANIQYDTFIRTTENRHKEAVVYVWKDLVKKGLIYKGVHEGWYSIADETFVTEDQVGKRQATDGSEVTYSLESEHPLEWMKEDNYLFRLSHFKSRLTSWLDRGGVIKPANFEPLVRQWIEQGLSDLSISRQRSRLQWGIPVPGDDSQTIYVWLDALVNYLTVVGYPHRRDFWPADCHVIGKDIVKFHAVYWPAFLMAADLDPPRSILCHSHWMIENHKMSKSLGNVVDPFDRIDRYTADGLRYFLLRQGVPHLDGNYSDEKVVEYLNAELVNTLGNLLSRITARSVNVRQSFPLFDSAMFNLRASEEDKEMWRNLRQLPSVVDDFYLDFGIYKAVDVVMAQLRQTNAFVQQHQPWKLVKQPEEKDWLDTVLHVSMESLAVCSLLLQPVVPGIADRVLTRLGVPLEQRMWPHIIDKDGECRTGGSSLGKDSGVAFQKVRIGS